ncbi:hypothetical protein CCMSSC00406_0007108 [Pleurotus cornucopiae]|uniref:Uncharacterized protein n=1 Tax=Pleurotus cornucopiae TaxID=5321 RepID=A0ACB7IPM4_PLECO|nr:hypothetical protein CCMSSC00406_0007108 [Pleurotus cornucopiae]
MSMDALRLEDLYITDPNQRRYWYTFFSELTDSAEIDVMECCLGLERGELDVSNKSCPISRSVILRGEMILSLQRAEWAMFPDEETIKVLGANLLKNGERATDDRLNWETIFPIQPEYTYTLYFNPDVINIQSVRGPCKSGETLITSSVHPALTLASITRFTLARLRKKNLSKICSAVLESNKIYLTTLLRRSFIEQDMTLHRPVPSDIMDDVEYGTPEKPTRCHLTY